MMIKKGDFSLFFYGMVLENVRIDPRKNKNIKVL